MIIDLKIYMMVLVFFNLGTRTRGVDTRDSSQNTFWPIWDSVSTLAPSSVDTRGLPRTPFGMFWDSVSTLAQVVSTVEALPEQNP
ncbi:hypothetical protein Taro_040638 [Colocasia esculenta]|uniref:Secreted protein n=1 Tax=Colocasia esculenta TaxID=4460 RepID=A0A843WV47_COLES|nr:hypothetical protein [Colocasia esculenta]